MLRMRARGIQDLTLLRALERAPRALFMPQRYQDVAARDIALPIGGAGRWAAAVAVVASAAAEAGERGIAGWRRTGGGAFVARDHGRARAFTRLERGLTRGV